MIGLAQGAFDKSVPYTYQRSQFGQPVGTFQGMAFQIAQAAVDIESARLLTYNAARRKDEGRDFTREAAMAKYWSSVVAQRVAGSAIEWAGGVGFTRETGIEKYWRDSKIVRTSSIFQRGANQFLIPFISGRYLRRNLEHSATDHCQVRSEAILMIRVIFSCFISSCISLLHTI